MACKSPSRHRMWWSALSFPSDNHLNFQLPSVCCPHCLDTSREHLQLKGPREQRFCLLPWIHLCACGWEGSIRATSLLAWLFEIVDEIWCGSTTCAIHIVRCRRTKHYENFDVHEELLEVSLLGKRETWP